MEPLKNGHFGGRDYVHCQEVVLILEVAIEVNKCQPGVLFITLNVVTKQVLLDKDARTRTSLASYIPKLSRGRGKGEPHISCMHICA